MAQLVGKHVSSHQEEKASTTLTIEETGSSPATFATEQSSMPQECAAQSGTHEPNAPTTVQIEEPVVSTAALATEQRPVEEPIVPILETHQQ